MNDKYAFLISYVSLAEILPYEDIYERFLEVFGVIPFFMVFGNEQIAVEEYKCSVQGRKLELTHESKDLLYAVTALNNPVSQVNKWFETFKTDCTMIKLKNDLVKIAGVWEQQRQTAIKDADKIRTYREFEKQMVHTVASSYIKRQLPLKTFKVSSYPSVRLEQYCQYKKVHHTQKPITKNDVMDIKLCGIVPYVDKVITEKQQANFFREAANIIPELKHKEFVTLKDIR